LGSSPSPFCRPRFPIHRRGGLFNLGHWRMYIQASHTEPLLRLNLETRADIALLDRKVDEIDALLEPRSR
jgi:phosphomannomutase